MNIFALDQDPVRAAQFHCDRHVVKMIIEYAQLLSTAHRLLDGTEQVVRRNDRNRRIWLLPNEQVEAGEIVQPRCYNATHRNHPSAVWARQTDQNYKWLFELFAACSKEYTHRYGRTHKTWESLSQFLSSTPSKIQPGPQTPVLLAMPDDYRQDNVVEAYRAYYNGPKAKIAKWTNREIPEWFKPNLD